MSEHAPACPMAAFEAAKANLRTYGCPVCRTSAVDVNASDYFECRSCHRQFSRGAHHEEKGPRLFLETDADILPVVELPQRGTGNFPSITAFNEARERLERARPKRRK